MNAHVEIMLQGALDHLRVAWQTGEALLENVPFQDNPEQTRYNTLVAVQEMLTNVLRYAMAQVDDQPVRLSYDVGASGFAVEIRDAGPYFDPLAHESKELVEDAMPDDPGGYGILITRWVMDELEYRREGDWNVLRMAKRVAEPALEVEADAAESRR